MGASPSPGAETIVQEPSFFMLRSVARDGGGKVIPSATVTVYSAGTTTVIGTTTTGSSGEWEMYIDPSLSVITPTGPTDDTAMFDITISKTGYTTQTITRARR